MLILDSSVFFLCKFITDPKYKNMHPKTKEKSEVFVVTLKPWITKGLFHSNGVCGTIFFSQA